MKEQFPILSTGYIYLDTAASAQKPEAVLTAITEFYRTGYANVHRGLHKWAEYSTIQYENARKKVAEFLGVEENNIIFTSGTTMSMNLFAQSFPLTQKDTVITSLIDHHSTFVPWQQAAKKANATLKVIPVNHDASLNYQAAEELIKQGCSVLAITQLSNVTGEVIDIKRLAKLVHAQNGMIIVDGAQAATHLDLDVTDIDGFAFSGHKTYGPTGIGVAYGSDKLLGTLSPFIYGGEMIDHVKVEETTFANPPTKFEAGTPPIAQAVGLRAAIEWLEEHKEFSKKEQEATEYCVQRLQELEFIELVGPTNKVGAVAFTVKDVHAHDVAQYLDEKGIAIRAGHHCTQPLHDHLQIAASCRASFGLYNDKKDVDKLIEALLTIQEAFNV